VWQREESEREIGPLLLFAVLHTSAMMHGVE
jgi:hypothetical protein